MMKTCVVRRRPVHQAVNNFDGKYKLKETAQQILDAETSCPIKRLPWNIYETTKLFNFIQSRTRGTPLHIFSSGWWFMLPTTQLKCPSITTLAETRMTQINQSSMLVRQGRRENQQYLLGG
ncbi:hypothetical protein CAEBREN_18159 [Caenorhabditis brenneri]|uniref:Uncharacterized protein n=1 Tax=Caenorhabditis brenneri TaxID=135651 RepID=G0P508_CAEBE|nr:hypothetical protein CAEBREN_18159 [Caenorhabditis brenneri]